MHPEAAAQIAAALIALAGTIYAARRDRSTVLTFGDNVALRTFDGKYVTSTEAECRIVALGKDHAAIFRLANPREPFASDKKGYLRYGSRVAFCVVTHDRFVGADMNAGGELWARVGWVKEWETFTLVRPPGGRRVLRRRLRYGDTFGLRASNNKLVRYDAVGSGELAATNEDSVGEWEVFTFVPLKAPLQRAA
jgi:hypothetical protein